MKTTRRKLPWLIAAALAVAAPLASAAIISYTTMLDVEDPASAAAGTGTSTVTIDTTFETMRVEATFSGLTGTTTLAHIHCCVPPPGNAGVASQVPSFSGFPTGVTAGSYDMTFDLNDAPSFNPAFVTANGGVAGAQAALIAGLGSGQAYLNIHTSTFGSGEIRGFFAQVPEPASLALALVGLAGLGWSRRRRA